MLTKGERYTRQEIHDAVGGGSLQSYLPTKDGRVLCACLRLDTNPGAPEVILPGTGPGIERAADLLERQVGAIPVFLKRGSGAWEFVGEFQFGRRSKLPADIESWAQRTGRADITSVIELRAAGKKEVAEGDEPVGRLARLLQRLGIR